MIDIKDIPVRSFREIIKKASEEGFYMGVDDKNGSIIVARKVKGGRVEWAISPPNFDFSKLA